MSSGPKFSGPKFNLDIPDTPNVLAGEEFVGHGEDGYYPMTKQQAQDTGLLGESIGTMTQRAAEEKAKRRARFAAGGETMIAAAGDKAAALARAAQTQKRAPGQIRRDVERGVAEGLAAQSAGGKADIRALSASASEARAAGAAQMLAAELGISEKEAEAAMAKGEVGGTTMDVMAAVQEMGSEAEDRRERRKEWTEAMNNILAANKGFWDDDEQTVSRQIRMMVADYPANDPLRMEFEHYALQIENKDEDWGWDF